MDKKEALLLSIDECENLKPGNRDCLIICMLLAYIKDDDITSKVLELRSK